MIFFHLPESNPAQHSYRTGEARNMRFPTTALALIALSTAAMAHPMGNFSINHYSRLHFQPSGLQLTYVLDLAEIPTFQISDAWKAGADSQARQWVDNLALQQDGQPVAWQIR